MEQAYRSMLAAKLLGLLEPVLKASRVLGVLPLSKSLRISKIRLCFSSLVLLLLLVSIAFIGRLTISRESEQSDKYRVIIYFRLCFLFFIPAANVFKLATNSDKLQGVLFLLQCNELLLRRANVRISYDQNFVRTTVIARLLFIAIQEAFYFYSEDFLNKESLLTNAYFVLGIILVQLVQIQLYTFLHLLECQLHAVLNLTERRKHLKEFELQIVLQVQNRLISASIDLNSVYSHQTLFTIFFAYLSFIVGAYHISLNVRDYMDSGVIEVTETLDKASWVIYSFLDIYTLARKCLNTTLMGRRVNQALYRILVCSRQPELLHSDKLRLHFVVRRKMEFTACGLFKIDYTLVHSVLASTLTLLVIMIQMT